MQSNIGPVDTEAPQAPDRFMPDWAAITAVILGITAFAVAQGLTYPLISLMLERRGLSESVIGLNAASSRAGAVGAYRASRPWPAIGRQDTR